MAVGWIRDWAGVTETDGSTAISGTALTAGSYVVIGTRVAVAQTAAAPVGGQFTELLNSAGSAVRLQMWGGYAVGGETSFTFTEGGTVLNVVLSEFSGIRAASAVDLSATAATGSGTSASSGDPGTTTTFGDEMVVTCCAWSGAATAVSCAQTDSPFEVHTEGDNAINATILLHLSYLALAATENPRATWSWNTNRTSASGIITLKGLGGGGTASWSGQDYLPRRRRGE